MLKSNPSLQEILVLENAFSVEECEFIKNTIELRESDVLKMGEKDGYAFANRYHLKKNEQTNWIHDRIVYMVKQANQEFFQFNISFMTGLQLLEYKEKCYFDWHIDLGEDLENYTRKINALVFLSNPKDYEGGQLKFNMVEVPEIPDIKQEQGTLVIFPSYRPHSVEPVTKGIRYSLSGIFHGEYFR